MAWQWIADNKARKDLKRLPKEISIRIVGKLEFWVKSGNPLAFAERLTNYDLGMYRFRVGDYRITFDVDDNTIVILAVGHRREIYK